MTEDKGPDDVGTGTDGVGKGDGAEGRPGSPPRRRGVGQLFREHGALLGRVAMALLGDAAEVERVLETVAREAGFRSPADGVRPVVWLLGLLRTAVATQLSKLPIRARSTEPLPAQVAPAAPPNEAMPARAALAALRPTEREAVVLSLVGGLEAADVAVACNVDLATAKARISRGVSQLLQQREGGQREGGQREGDGGVR